MAILIINGIVVPEPTSMEPTEQDITDSNRTITGYMRGHVVRHDVHTLECGWAVLTADEYAALADAISSKYGLSVFYHIPEKNATAELTMYVGDRKKKVWHCMGGTPVYKNVSMKFVEE